MGIIKIIGIVIGIVIISAIAFYGIMSVVHPILYGEGVYYQNSYPNFNAAAAANAIGGGRIIPAFLPRSATEIRFQTYSDLDISRLWLSFIFDTDDTAEINEYCRRITNGKVKYWGGSPEGDFIRWPEELTGTIRIGEMHDYEFYSCKGESVLLMSDEILSVNLTTGRAYYAREASFSGG